MPEAELIDIEVACAWPEKQVIRSLRVPVGTTARQALHLSGLEEVFTTIDIRIVSLGIFGRVVSDDYEPCAGERVEVYRSLRRDPREARLARL